VQLAYLSDFTRFENLDIVHGDSYQRTSRRAVLDSTGKYIYTYLHICTYTHLSKERLMLVVALLNQKGGVGKTTLSVHLATAFAETGRVLLIDADPQHSTLDWAAQRETAGPFSVIGLPKPILHSQMAALGVGYDWVIIDGPPRANELARSAIAASDLVIVPVQPSPYDVWAAKDIVDIVRECEITKPSVMSRLLINRLFPNTRLAGEVTDALSEHEMPILDTVIRNRTEYAKSARLGLTALETEPNGPAAKEIRQLATEVTTLLEKQHAKHC
jgi:chromosome partitioning protein